MKVLFLYTELADYTLACLKALKKNIVNPDIAVIHYPINSEAPFDFDFGETGEFTNIKAFESYYSLKKHVDAFVPDKIVVSGWANKWYVRVCMAYRKRSICILSMDNHWTGSLKQQLFTLIFRSTLIRIFKKIWVPGKPQVAYAKKLGFKECSIMHGFYCCDTEFYLNVGKKTLPAKSLYFPNRLLCVARYIPQKNYALLWEAFATWKEKTNNNWELWCAGTGVNFEQRMQHPAIRHLGFVQKESWNEVIEQTSVFILPSNFEPWAVAVHEFAAAGYPLILSSKVGAGTAFLQRENGWLFNPADKERLIEIFTQLASTSPDRVHSMALKSMEMARKITPDSWASALLEA